MTNARPLQHNPGGSACRAYKSCKCNRLAGIAFGCAGHVTVTQGLVLSQGAQDPVHLVRAQQASFKVCVSQNILSTNQKQAQTIVMLSSCIAMVRET